MKKIKFRTAEFRVKTPGIRWEDCEIVDTLNDCNRVEADKRAQDISVFYGGKVRWNWEGGKNGHYFGGKP